MATAMIKVCFLFSLIFGFGYGYFSKIDVPNVISDIADKVPNPAKFLFVKKCYGDLGCFETKSPFFHPTVRPISLPPSEPLARFKLFTPSNPEEAYDLEISLESLKNSTFDAKLPTKFLIHGFRSDLETGDIRHDIRLALLEHADYNVIIVDWTANNGFPYAQAASNTRTNGAKTAKLIHFLMNNTGITPDSIHIIGHSLGAQMAGYIGERVPKLGRITGLDPAGPFFQGLHRKVRLDPSDAQFVDVIHTDGGECVLNGLGYSQPIGHIDFYPNGGRRQPGCTYTSERENIVGAAVNYTTKWILNGCDHERANQYFLESIKSECKFLAVKCLSYKHFEKGRCNPKKAKVAEMGFHAKPLKKVSPPARFYLRTNPDSPYCNQGSINI